MSTNHSNHHHIVTRGSMYEAHNTDDLLERSRICKRETQQVKPVSSTQAKRIGTNVEALRKALREREAQEKLNNQ